MDIFEAIFTRRSIREFKKQPVEEEKIEKIFRAAMSAPSAGNEQLWHFIVINDRNLLDQIPNFHPYSQMCFEAPLAIVCCADLLLQKHEGFWVQDIAAATQNILLAVRALELGAVWLGVYPNTPIVNGLKKLLNLPENIVPVNIIPIGYTKLKPFDAGRYKPERVHRNSWD